jgi:hypothetical protein
VPGDARFRAVFSHKLKIAIHVIACDSICVIFMSRQPIRLVLLRGCANLAAPGIFVLGTASPRLLFCRGCYEGGDKSSQAQKTQKHTHTH